jgi:hypothetical protein
VMERQKGGTACSSLSSNKAANTRLFRPERVDSRKSWDDIVRLRNVEQATAEGIEHKRAN